MRRSTAEHLLGNRELSLRDLVMDVPSDLAGTGEPCSDRDEMEGTRDVQGLNLRELAQEL
jgi:hypothetical protein